MKRFIFTSISALTLLVAIVPSVFAQTSASAAFTTAQSTRSIPDITPNDLVSLAYQGFFTTQGIPSAGALLDDYQFGQLTARNLVLAGIQADRLSRWMQHSQA
jgi:hypothetical protein